MPALVRRVAVARASRPSASRRPSGRRESLHGARGGQPAHTHPVANEWAYILSGEWVESNVAYGPGTLFHAPKGERHGPHVAKSEVISLTIFDGPLTVV